jgi:hypothetical protein
VANYLMTVGLMQAADEMGMSCPADYGLASFDDYPWLRYFRPRLTTIELPKYELGVRSTQILLERISGKQGKPTVQRLAPQLCVRESCGFIRTLQTARLQFPNSGLASSTGQPAGPIYVAEEVESKPQELSSTSSTG